MVWVAKTQMEEVLDEESMEHFHKVRPCCKGPNPQLKERRGRPRWCCRWGALRRPRHAQCPH